MSYNQYSGYGGNPYEDPQAGQYGGAGGGYGSSNPYGGGSSNPYGGSGGGYDQQSPQAGTYGQVQGYGGRQHMPPAAPQHQPSAYSQASDYGDPSQQQTGAGGVQYGAPADAPPLPEGGVEYIKPDTVLSNQDFLSRVEAAKADIRTLTTHVGQIASAHQRTLSSPDASSSGSLENTVTQTQVLNTSIKDQIKFLERDAARSPENGIKQTQIKQLKTSFQKQLQEYRVEEANYEKRYREQIARQYRIVNPEASESEVQEAADADWGNEGVFQTALKSNRTATASTVLGAVRARHNDIQKIEKTMIELNQLMEDLATTIVLQDEPIQQTEQRTEQVKNDTEAGNVHLDKGVASARRARKLKWWCFWIVVAIICILALVLGLYFGLNTDGGSGAAQ
ncbi:hypothetical protein MBLNU230_g6657t1 [Neophaeotheca triangularis]